MHYFSMSFLSSKHSQISKESLRQGINPIPSISFHSNGNILAKQNEKALRERQLCLKPVWWSMLSKTIVLGASLVETSPHLDWAATRLNVSQHHQSSSHSEQIATIPYSQQIGQFPQNRLNLGLWSWLEEVVDTLLSTQPTCFAHFGPCMCFIRYPKREI